MPTTREEDGAPIPGCRAASLSVNSQSPRKTLLSDDPLAQDEEPDPMKRLICSERFSREALRIGVALSIFWWGGCSSRKEKDTGNISGKLTISGEPLPAGGDVTFMSREGIGGTSKVGEGGLYAISKIPVGTYKVVVIPPPLPHPHENKRGQGRGPGAEKYPMKYQADNSSDLSSEIKKGDQTQDFDLKPGDASPGGGRKRKP